MGGFRIYLGLALGFVKVLFKIYLLLVHLGLDLGSI